MKFLASQFSVFFNTRRTQINARKLMWFLLVLVVMYVSYSLLFHYIAEYEGRNFSWLTGFYWTLVTMSTLGFGDIVFTSDLGKLFSMVVLFSGVFFLLILLPFTFIEFFYQPWLEAMNQVRAPKELGDKVTGHVVISHYEPNIEQLINKLQMHHIEYVILEPDLNKALDMADQKEYKVLNLDPTVEETYDRLNLKEAAMVVASGPDTVNTNVTFTARVKHKDVKIIAMANHEDSVDILQLAGANRVIQVAEILGRAMARRTLGGNARVHVIGHIDKLVIGEAMAQDTPLVGKTLAESRLRENTGTSVVGVWQNGKFCVPKPETVIDDRTVLVIAGSVAQMRKYDELFSIYHASDEPVIIIGGGRVGRAAARALSERQVDYRIVDKNPALYKDDQRHITGDAADRDVLLQAGIREAHTVLITTHDDDMNIYLTIYCRKLNPGIQIISRSSFERNVDTMQRAGSDFVMSYSSMSSNAIFNILEGQDVIVLAEGMNIFNHRIESNSLAGKTILNSGIRQKTECTIVAIQCPEDGMKISPDPTHRLEKGQELILIGSPKHEAEFLKLFDT
ncbi:MAG: potassium transporter TrkA [Bacteroidetes bacterium]|nr:MAG: potassium transporter TrkA [Bacteroidota bacterium]PTM19839.1 MAG: potassium transporter TrkA [Bacteroidota bacterium]